MLSVVMLAACGSSTDPVPTGDNIVEDEQPGATWSCVDRDSCTADYQAFIELAADHAKPITEDELDGQLAALAAHQVPTTTESQDVLGDRILDTLNLRFLRDGIADRPLHVGITARSETADYLERDLLFTDPYVGTFEGILLLPKTGEPVPGVVALHGHPDSAAIYRDDYHGKEWPGRGYAILMITSRAMAIDDSEHAISHDLLRAGFTLMGLRAYEALLALEYLRTRPEVQGDRIGLIGHSGGSSTADLLTWIEPGFQAVVSDNTVDWYSSGEDEPYHCETVPGLYPYNVKINNFLTAPRPVQQVPYGYIFGMEMIFQFFDDHLR